MAYDRLRTLSFRLKEKVNIPPQTFQLLKFPEKWKQALITLQSEITKRDVHKVNVPIYSLNKALRALVPDLIYIAPNAAQRGDRPWLYSEAPINPEALYLIIRAWVNTQFNKATEQQRSQLLKQLKVEDLSWQPTQLDVNEWKQAPNGTADLGGNSSFILFPHLVAAKFSKPDVTLKFGSDLLHFRRAPLSIGSRGAELVSWNPLEYKDCYWSVVITFTLQTVPFQHFPVLHCDLSLRRWASLPKTHIPGGQETSVYLLTEVPWLEGFNQSNSFQVAPIKWQKIPKAEQQEGQPKYRVIWGSNLPSLLDKLNFQHQFPTAQDIVTNPAEALNLQGNPNTAVVYRNGMKPEHSVDVGLGPEDRRSLAEQIAELLAPDWEFVEMLPRVKFTNVLTTLNIPKKQQSKLTEDRSKKLTESQTQLSYAVNQKVGNALTIEIWYQHKETPHELTEAVRHCLGIPESGSFPYKFSDLDFTLDIKSQPLGALGDELELNSQKPNQKERRQAILQRSQEVAEKLESIDNVTVAFIELAGADKFSKETDPKKTLRLGFARMGRLTQFISSTDKTKRFHKGINGFLDLLRQLGVQLEAPKISIEEATLPAKINYVGVWLIKQTSPTSADGGTQRIPVMVYMASDSTEINATAFGMKEWLPYPEILLKLAQGEAKGVARMEQAIPFIEETLKRDILPLGDTLLLCHAQNLRTPWSWLQNGKISTEKVQFGKRTFNINRLKGLRIVRLRDNQSHETPEWYAQKEDEQGFTEGIFKMGDRVFASTAQKPAQFKKLSVNLSKTSSWTTKKGKTFEASPDTYYWNPSLLELTVACVQPNDEIWSWAALTHQLRYIALQYDETLKLPLPLHLAKQMEEYVLLIETEKE